MVKRAQMQNCHHFLHSLVTHLFTETFHQVSDVATHFLKEPVLCSQPLSVVRQGDDGTLTTLNARRKVLALM